MLTRRTQLDWGIEAIELENDDLRIVVLPHKGSDIYALIDRQSGVDFLFKAPWGLRPPDALRYASDSSVSWIALYAGGWPVLLPNAGAPSIQQGVEWGFHGEAATVPWRVDDMSDHSVWLSTDLVLAPLHLTRQITALGPTLSVIETVSNQSPDPIEVAWGHHPTLGSPFLEEGCRIAVRAHRFLADDTAPGDVLAPGSAHEWPLVQSITGEQIDFSVIPGPSTRRAVLGYLMDLAEPTYTITNPRLGLGFRLTWPADVFPHLWFWQEIHATPGFPWFRRAYTTALEPHSTVPASGLAAAKQQGGGGVVLPGHGSRTVTVEATVLHGARTATDK